MAWIRDGRSTGSVEVYPSAGLKAALATPATCTRSAGRSSASPRRNIPGRSGRGTCPCSIFSKGCVWIGCSCLGSASSSVLASGQKRRYAKHDQSCRPPRFLSHKEHFTHEFGDVNRDLAEQPKCPTGGALCRNCIVRGASRSWNAQCGQRLFRFGHSDKDCGTRDKKRPISKIGAYITPAVKIAFISPPIPGHLNPMTTLARELQSRNHDAVFISLPDGERSARAAGLTFSPVPPRSSQPARSTNASAG